jgi:hypothetical protein
MDEALFFFSDNYFAPAVVQQPVCKHDSYRELQVALFWFCFRTICIYAVTRELLYVGVPFVASYVKAALLHAMGFKKDTFAEAVGEAVEAAEEAVESLVSEIEHAAPAPPAAAPTPPISVPAAPPASPVDAATQTDLLE